MLRRTAQLSVGLLLAFCPVLLSGQATQPQIYVFCAAQAPPPAPGGTPIVYYSGIMQGTAANLANFRNDFTQFLMQRFAYKGAANCAPANSMANAQTAMNNQMTALRNAKRDVVQTGWTEGGLGGILSGGNPLGGGTNPLSSGSNPLGSILGGGQSNTNSNTSTQPKAPATGGQSGAASGGGGGNGANQNQNSVGNIFGQIFGANNNGGGAKPAQGQTTTAGKPTTGGTGTTGTTATGGGGSQSPFSQVSSLIFGNKGGANGGGGNGGGNPARGGQPGGGNTPVASTGTPGQLGGRGAKPGQPAQPEGVLGSAQFGTTKLDVYGCGRQDLQVACVAELTNTNAKDTLVKSTDIWKDAFIVDDRGDRHTRTNAFFLNVDGEQRPQLDISNGKTAKFVLMFDQVPAKVESIALRSQNGDMDVENIGLVAADASAPGATSASASGPAPTPPPTQH